MPLATLYSRDTQGIDAPLVKIETHITNGLPGFSIVGMAETAVKESKDRVRSAIMTSNFDFPVRRITVNLAPADLPKTSGRFDLPIALSILAASRQLPTETLESYEWAGELGLSGDIRPIRSVLPLALKTKHAQRSLVLPSDNAQEAALVKDINVYPVGHLLDISAHLHQQQLLTPQSRPEACEQAAHQIDFADVKGQEQAKQALAVAAAGGHSVLMSGPPGTGKSMLASRLPTIMPAMTEEQALENTAVKSLHGMDFDLKNWRNRPFRAPHHSASNAALVGGGRPPKPGEISLAHQGVLFLDELPEYKRDVLESLREPLESGHVTISRASHQVTFPADFQCIAAMNPCPCGYDGDHLEQCRCSPEQIQRYLNKLSGPLLDRFDLFLQVARPKHEQLAGQSGLSSADLRARVDQARERQYQRQSALNASLGPQQLKTVCRMEHETAEVMKQAAARLKLSARSYDRALKVARTLADLDSSDTIQTTHISEAMVYRQQNSQR